MTSWQLQTAKARFSELIRTVKDKGPQAITLHGREEVIVISKKEYVRLKGHKSNLVEFFKHSPFHGVDLDLERNNSVSREIEF